MWVHSYVCGFQFSVIGLWGNWILGLIKYSSPYVPCIIRLLANFDGSCGASCALSIFLFLLIPASSRRNGGDHAAAVGSRQILQRSLGLWDQTSPHHPLCQLPVRTAPAVQHLDGTSGLQPPPGNCGIRSSTHSSQVNLGREPVLQRTDGREV